MRYFKHHPSRDVDVVVIGADDDGDRTGKKKRMRVHFYDWFFHIVGSDNEKTGKNFETLTSARKALDAVRTTPEGQYIALEDADWKLIESIMKEPRGIQALVNLQLHDWIASIVRAPEKMPSDVVITTSGASADAE
jgi:hypothetical protein